MPKAPLLYCVTSPIFIGAAILSDGGPCDGSVQATTYIAAAKQKTKEQRINEMRREEIFLFIAVVEVQA